MASKSSPATSRLKEKAPAAARPGTSTFGENRVKPTTERRSPRPVSIEKRTAGSRGGEDLAKIKEQLSLVEKSKSYLAQDLARSRRTVEELTAKLHEANEACRRDKLRAEEMEHASFTAAEDCQAELEVMKQRYEAAVVNLQTNKQAMENLKHELEVCVKAKDEAVRLAGEAMNAAESTTKKVEELSAELLATKGSIVTLDSAASRMDELMNELSAARQGLAEATASREKISNEKAAILAARESDLKEIAEAASSARIEIEGLKRDLELAKKSEQQIAYLSSTLEHLRSELASAKAAEQNALMTASDPNVGLEWARSEVAAAKRAELVALASLAKVSAELEATQENLVKATVEGATLATFLEFLKSELERSQLDVIGLKERGTNANFKAESLNAQLTKLMESNQMEIMVLKERESDAYATAESLKIQLEGQKLEIAKLIQRELSASAKAAGLTSELETNRRLLAEQQERELSSVPKVTALTRELESSRVELLALKERELALTSKTAVLTVELNNKEAEAVELKERLRHTNAKVSALSAELNMLNETHQINLLELREREAVGTAKSADLDAELMKLKQDLEEALKVANLAREEADNLHLALQTAKSEKEQARQEAQILSAEAERSRQDAMVALAELEAARDEVQTALEAADAARLEVDAGAEKIILAREDAKAAREEAQLARIQAETASEEKLRGAIEKVQVASKEVAHAQDEAQSARKEAELLHFEMLVEKEQANAAREEAQILRAEVEKLKTELDASQKVAHEAQTAWTNAEDKLQDALKKMAAVEVNVSSIQGECKDCPEMVGVAVLQEELDLFKLKLQNAEACLGATRAESEAFRKSKEELLRELRVAREEIDFHKGAALEAQQHFAETEKARLIMEMEIQTLLDDSKRWQTSEDAIDIPVHSEMNGAMLSLESREQKPQPDSLDQVLSRNPSLVHKDDNQKKQVNQKQEFLQKNDAKEKDEVASKDVLSLQTKKKKRALLSRLGTYLEKKKNQQTM